MFVEMHKPTSLLGEELDTYLAHGWFRMGQAIFTTNFLHFDNTLYSAIWLRIDLKNFEPSKTQQKLIKNNAHFNVAIKPLSLKAKHEKLFQKYRTSITFEPASTVFNLLNGYSNQENSAEKSIFNTYEVSIYDDKKLIATGIFDLGQTTSAGISCFYDPAYKKYSLGKYLMLLKMQFAKAQGLRYFYPGYFAPGYKLFDYKLDLSKQNLEYLDVVSQNWYSFSNYSPENIPLDSMRQKLLEIGNILKQKELKYQFKYYDFFDADMVHNLNGLGLFDFPMFLYCYELQQNTFILPIIIFDIRDNQYHLVLCNKVYKSIYEESEPEHYNTYLLQLSKYLYSGEVADEMAEVIEIYKNSFSKIDVISQ